MAERQTASAGGGHAAASAPAASAERPAPKPPAPRPDLSAGYVCAIGLLMVEGMAARSYGLPGVALAGVGLRIGYPALLVCAGALTGLTGLLVALRHWSVRGIVARTAHPSEHGAIVIFGGLCYAGLYTAVLVTRVPLWLETAILFATVEAVTLLLLALWLRERRGKSA
jgi:hypothetical protein